jgi:hypothetical protein
MVALPDHDAMVASIVRTYRDASPEQVAAGRGWYPAAGAIVAAIAAATGRTPGAVGATVAALSPRNPWRWNVQDAYAFACAARDGGATPTATTFGVNARSAWSLIHGRTGWTSAAPKVRSFVANILGDVDAVTVDTWAIRVATDGALVRVTDREYGPVQDAYRAAAVIVAETPRDVQAVTWIVAQSRGLASSRRGRHDLAYKRGTAPFVISLLSGQMALELGA